MDVEKLFGVYGGVISSGEHRIWLLPFWSCCGHTGIVHPFAMHTPTLHFTAFPRFRPQGLQLGHHVQCPRWPSSVGQTACGLAQAGLGRRPAVVDATVCTLLSVGGCAVACAWIGPCQLSSECVSWFGSLFVHVPSRAKRTRKHLSVTSAAWWGRRSYKGRVPAVRCCACLGQQKKKGGAWSPNSLTTLRGLSGGQLTCSCFLTSRQETLAVTAPLRQAACHQQARLSACGRNHRAWGPGAAALLRQVAKAAAAPARACGHQPGRTPTHTVIHLLTHLHTDMPAQWLPHKVNDLVTQLEFDSSTLQKCYNVGCQDVKYRPHGPGQRVCSVENEMLFGWLSYVRPGTARAPVKGSCVGVRCIRPRVERNNLASPFLVCQTSAVRGWIHCVPWYPPSSGFRIIQTRIMLLAILHGLRLNPKLKSILERCADLTHVWGTTLHSHNQFSRPFFQPESVYIRFTYIANMQPKFFLGSAMHNTLDQEHSRSRKFLQLTHEHLIQAELVLRYWFLEGCSYSGWQNMFNSFLEPSCLEDPRLLSHLLFLFFLPSGGLPKLSPSFHCNRRPINPYPLLLLPYNVCFPNPASKDKTWGRTSTHACGVVPWTSVCKLLQKLSEHWSNVFWHIGAKTFASLFWSSQGGSGYTIPQACKHWQLWMSFFCVSIDWMCPVKSVRNRICSLSRKNSSEEFC